MSKFLIFAIVFFLSAYLMFGIVSHAHSESRDERNGLKVGKGAVEDLHQKMRSYLEREQIQNISFGVWQNGALISEGNYGPVSDTVSEPVSDSTIYRIRSMTKPITAMALLILMERGHFKLNDPITKFVPEFEDTEVLADHDESGELYTFLWLYPPTMEHLLSHTAGLAYARPNGGVIDSRLSATSIAQSPNADSFTSTLASVPYVSMPGAEWHYSFASDLQGVIIERITGKPLADVLALEIFTPLEMNDTAFYVANQNAHRLSGVSRIVDGKMEYAELESSDRTSQSQVYYEGGHGLYSTRADYLKFLNLIRENGQVGDRQIISQVTLERFRTNAIRYRGGEGRQRSYGQGAGLGYGLGIGTIEAPQVANVTAPKGTVYWNGALGTWFWVDPVNDIIFIGMIQSDGVVEPDLMKSAMSAIYGAPVLNQDFGTAHVR